MCDACTTTANSFLQPGGVRTSCRPFPVILGNCCKNSLLASAESSILAKWHCTN